MHTRHIRQEVSAALADTPVVFISGARQVGKSTLVREISETQFQRPVFSLDDNTLRHQAKRDPAGFIRQLPLPVAIDEVQHVPELLYEIKALVDERRFTKQEATGLFLLTGSTEIWDHADSLAGRIERLQLWPLSQGEIHGRREGFIDNLFANTFPSSPTQTLTRDELADMIVRGGYPEAHTRTPARRNRWLQEYVSSIVERDVRQLSLVRTPELLNRLFVLTVTRSGNLLNINSLIADLDGVKRPTGHRYFEPLKRVYLIHTLPAWSTNTSTSLVKSPKVYANDTGLLCAMVGYGKQQLINQNGALPAPGNIFETFVVNELIKQASWHPQRPKPFHYRDRNNREVDLLLESTDGSIVGLEYKYKEQLDPSDWSGLTHLQHEIGKQFQAGAVIYTGKHTLQVEDQIWAIPVEQLLR